MFEEWGGNPYDITLVKREVASVCSDIFEWQPTLVNWQLLSSGKVDKPLRPKAHLSCASGQKISSIKFASFGTPEGSCGNFQQGSCHAFHSFDVFERVFFIYKSHTTLLLCHSKHFLYLILAYPFSYSIVLANNLARCP